MYRYLIIIFILLILIYYIIILKNKETFDVKNKKILIIYTGGTIGMVHSDKGLIPQKGFLEKKLKEIVGNNKDISSYEIKEYDPLLDSSDLSPKDWVKIGNDIFENYHKYDAFIIIHGTDTMAYTASALSFMFKNLDKTIIITGSMIPLVELRNDGAGNLIDSLYIASKYNIPEVILVFGNRILRGNRSTKVHADGITAFASPNYFLIGENGVDITIDKKLFIKSFGKLEYTAIDPNKKVIILKVFPGIDNQFINNALSDQNVYGVVLETFGIGDAPSNQNFLNAIKNAINRGVIIVNVTQCIMGRVDQGDYATGSGLKKAGVISGYDMTPEAVMGKLYYLLSRYSNREIIKKLIEENLRGELTKNAANYQQTGSFL